MEELISIIVPIYNTRPDYLNFCLKQLQNQTYKNIEVICVDGGSVFETLTIINSYLCDDRFKLIKTTCGVSHQRNVGIDNCKGAYVCFVDSDDFVDNCFISYLYSSITTSKTDIAIPLIYRCEFEGRKLISRKPYDVIQLEERVTNQNFFKYSRIGELVNPVKLYKTSLVKKTRFLEECSYGEDLLFNYYLSKHSYDTSFVPEAIYNYRVILRVNNTGRRLDKKGLYIIKALAAIIKSKEILSNDSVIELYREFDYVFKEFYYSLALNKNIRGLIWISRYKLLYFKNHHGFHDIIFLLFPILVVARRKRKERCNLY